MILAAGLGTRLRPLTDYRAKPALPIRGRAVISLLLDFLRQHGVRDVMINLHYLPQTIRDAIDTDGPTDMKIVWSEEAAPLGTGGGIRRAAAFLSEEEECIVLAGDMLLDLDLGLLLERHRQSQRDATLILREDSRSDDFGTIGVDVTGDVTRVGKRRSGGTEIRSGLFTGVRIFSRSVFHGWPDTEIFEDLRDWLIPGMESGYFQLGGDFVDPNDSVWEPVGTPSEYLRVNLSPPSMPSLGGSSEHWGGDIEISGSANDVVLGPKAEIAPDARLERAVVWAGEKVPPGFVGHDGVFAAGRFIDCGLGSLAMGQSH
jgi:mannose-1-phosphate guanylyltransferase